VIDGAYTVKQAAGKLGISARWVKALKKAGRSFTEALTRHPANATDEGLRKKIIALKKSDKYQKPTLSTFGNRLKSTGR
jgi:hypothetical protein